MRVQGPLCAGGVQLIKRLVGLAEQMGLVESDRGVRGQGDQEGDIVRVKGALAAVGGEEHTYHVGPEDERHPRIETSPSSATASSIGPVLWKRSSSK